MRIGVLAGAAFMLAAIACGGNAEPGGATPASTASASGAGGAATTAAKATGAASGASGGGALDACKLLTADEVARVTGIAVGKVTPTPGEPSYCSYENSAGRVIAGTVYARNKDFPGSSKDDVVIPGLGEKAKYSATGGSGLQILKGGTFVAMNLSAGAGDLKPEQILDLLKQLGAIAAPRQ